MKKNQQIKGNLPNRTGVTLALQTRSRLGLTQRCPRTGKTRSPPYPCARRLVNRSLALHRQRRPGLGRKTRSPPCLCTRRLVNRSLALCRQRHPAHDDKTRSSPRPCTLRPINRPLALRRQRRPRPGKTHNPPCLCTRCLVNPLLALRRPRHPGPGKTRNPPYTVGRPRHLGKRGRHDKRRQRSTAPDHRLNPSARRAQISSGPCPNGQAISRPRVARPRPPNPNAAAPARAVAIGAGSFCAALSPRR